MNETFKNEHKFTSFIQIEKAFSNVYL